MLYFFFKYFSSDVSIFNVFKYITFRTGISVATSLIFILFIGESLIAKLKSFQRYGQPIRDDGPLSHIIKKSGTPTMGGLIIILSILFSTLLWADLTNKYVLILISCLCGRPLKFFIVFDNQQFTQNTIVLYKPN